MTKKITVIILFCIIHNICFTQIVKLPYVESQEKGYFKVLQIEKSKTKFTLDLVISYTTLVNANNTFTFIESPKGSSDEIVIIDADSGKEYKTLNSVLKTHILNKNDFMILNLTFEPLNINVKRINLIKKGEQSDSRSPSILNINGISLLDYTKNSNQVNYDLMYKKIQNERLLPQTKKMMDSIVKLSNINIHPNGFFYEILKSGNGYKPSPKTLKNITFSKTIWNIRLVYEHYDGIKNNKPDEIASLSPIGRQIFKAERKSWHYTMDEVKYLMDEGAHWRVIIPTITYDSEKNRFGGYTTAYRFIDIETEKLYR